MAEAPERVRVDDEGNAWVDGLQVNCKARPMRPTRYVRADLVPHWQPIETAPEMQAVLTWSKRDGRVIGVNTGEEWLMASDVKVDPPTMWQPLPAPPAQDDNETEERG